MKRNLLLLCLFLSCHLFLSAQSVHVLKRGETLESVAQKYGITADEIKNANPQLVRVYAGMKLNIPKPTSQQVEQTAIPDNSTIINNSANFIPNGQPLAQLSDNANEEMTDAPNFDTSQTKKESKKISKKKNKKELTEAELLAKAEKKQRRKERWGKIANFLGKAGTVLATAGVAALTYGTTETSQTGVLGTLEKVNNALDNAGRSLATGGVQGFMEGIQRATGGVYNQSAMPDGYTSGGYMSEGVSGDMIPIDDVINQLTSEYNQMKSQVDAYDNDNQRRASRAKTVYTNIGGKPVKRSIVEPSKRNKNMSSDNMVVDQVSKNATLSTMALWKKKIDHFQRLKSQGVKYVSDEERRGVSKAYSDASDKARERHKQTVNERHKSNYKKYYSNYEDKLQRMYYGTGDYSIQDVRDTQRLMKDVRGKNSDISTSKWESWDGIRGSM